MLKEKESRGKAGLDRKTRGGRAAGETALNLSC